MKSLISYFFILFLWVCASCNSEFSNTEKDPICDNSELLCQISSFNDSISKSKVITRSRSADFLYWMSVVSADCAGAYEGGRFGIKCGAIVGHPHVGAAIGALVAGGWSSYLTHRALTRSIEQDELQVPIKVVGALTAAKEQNVSITDNFAKNIILPLPITETEIREIGAKHNIVLQNLIENNIDTTNIREHITDEELDIIQSEEFKLNCKIATEKIQNYFSSGHIQQTAGVTISDKLMNMFYEVYQEYSDSCEDAQFIISKYTEAVVGTSELSEEDKQIVLQAISVAASSYEFWMPNTNNN